MAYAVWGAITRERLEAVRESDAILREEFANAGLDKTVWQYFTIVPDFKSVGVRDNARCFDYPVIIRAVNTVDAMTAASNPSIIQSSKDHRAHFEGSEKCKPRVLRLKSKAHGDH